ncbi:Hypothetical predicted protein [Pelobates cultripes]|uniref:Uncharacterized protein n=1 Tax=Pelobates cultripes TaxID=61616 RepID=A0AAD1TLU4_PELCU|nr:Hypothetical predicted protein [Pelobates cultripes]
MTAQPEPSKQSTRSGTHTSLMTIFDWTCAGLRAALQNRGATHCQAERTVSSWMRPAAQRRHYMQVPQASRMAVRQNRYRRASRRGPAPGLSDTRKAEISNPAMHATKAPDLNLGYQHNIKRHSPTNTAIQATKKLHTTERHPGADP